MLASVDLPAPFSPRRAWISPSWASRSTESLARTPGNRFVIERMATAGTAPAVTSVSTAVSALGNRSDNALDEPHHAQYVAQAQLGPGRHLDRAGLVLQGPGELVEAAVLQSLLLGVDRGHSRSIHRLAERRQVDEPILQAAVVAGRLPRTIHRRLDAHQLVRPPVVDRRGEPRVGCIRGLVRVVAGPFQALGLRRVPCGRAVLALAEDVDAGRDQ